MADQLRSANGIHAIAFDLDSTLSYDPASTQEVLAEALSRTGESHDLIGDLETATSTYGALWVKTERSCTTTHETRVQLWSHLLRGQSIEDPDRADRLATAYDGVASLPAWLRPKMKLGKITNGSTETQWEKIDQLGVRHHFDEVLVAEDLGIDKPDSRIFLELAHRLGVSPHEMLFVGDSFESDIIGAASVDMKTAWIRQASGTVRPDYQWTTVCTLREVLC